MDTCIYELGDGLHDGVKSLDLFPLGFGVHGRSHILANVKSNLDEV
jgi:hypothetical protein